MKRPHIYTAGDSHCVFAWCEIPDVTTYTAGPMTMYSWGLNKNKVCGAVPKDAIVVMCSGEIDCRCHVHNHQPWKETIDDLVDKYLIAIREETADRDLKNVWIYNVVPPLRPDEIVAEAPNYPLVGSGEERVQYVKYMNKKLSESEFTFVDVYDKYSDENGFMKFKLSDGHHHIQNSKYLSEWLENYFKNRS